ncbi:MAG TPA: transglycosylase SLT domain-containing protein, partial [Vicinamibacterales bacterium]|nr:transglycosylase SLT domain-containing protein [Vicinamibacterales bacterium]
ASSRHFEAGQRELEIGHLEQAKTEFNRSLEVLLESPYGARSEPRIREHFDRLVDRISAYELTALTEGDGFKEKPSEPATIDQLLALSLFDQPEPTPELTDTVKSDLENTSHDVPIPLNPRVLSYIELFQGRLRSFITEGLVRGSKYLPMIQNVFRAEGLPLDLAYVPLVESAFKPNALSRASAKGVWQFMRGTALENGLRHDWYVDERSDPEKSTLAAAKYLKTLSGMFDGDWHLALASYNGGPGRVQRAMKRSGRQEFWSLAASARYLPRETREYVPMILAAIVIAKNPAQYGFDIQPEPGIPSEKVTLPSPVDLRRIAEWTDSPIDTIQALNPELRRWTTPVRSDAYTLNVPEGSAERVTSRLEWVPPAERAALNWYTVRRGESLQTIARKLRVSRGELAAANYLSVRAPVRAGQQLVIPRAPATLMAARPDRPVPLAESRRVAASSALVSDAPSAQQSKDARLIYQVKRGDTLSSIARVFQTSVPSLRRWNHLAGNHISVGDRLLIFTSGGRRASR